MAKKEMPYRPVLEISGIREALQEADRLLDGKCESVSAMLRHLKNIVAYEIDDLVEYQTMNNKWTKGVIVAYMVCEPRYICGTGDDREKPGKKLLACTEKHVRPRKPKKGATA